MISINMLKKDVILIYLNIQ